MKKFFIHTTENRGLKARIKNNNVRIKQNNWRNFILSSFYVPSLVSKKFVGLFFSWYFKVFVESSSASRFLLRMSEETSSYKLLQE